ERLAVESIRRRRLKKLRNTPASQLSLGHIDSLELLELARPAGIKVIYDIGANIGTWTLLAKSVIAEASVDAFKPFTTHLASYKDNLRGVAGVKLHCLAL